MRKRFPWTIWLPLIKSESDILNIMEQIKNSGMKETSREKLLNELQKYHEGVNSGKYEFSPR